MSPRDITVRPVTTSNWQDFVRLFEARGSPHYCFCTPYRARNNEQLDRARKKALMHGLVRDGTPIGVLAYSGDEPVGWCSIAPRETYVKLERSQKMARRTPAETPTWTVLCFFLARPYRKRGIARALLEGAVAYARAQGAKVVEGYPFDTAGISSTHLGHSSLFDAVRFRQDPGDRRWSRVFRK
jgi:GNAT superfamily N-acetyltransferase